MAILSRNAVQLLGWGGAVLLATSLVWWGTVFLRVIANGYLSTAEAFRCSLASSIVCDLATSLCGKTHPFGITWYSPILLWIAVALLSATALLLPDNQETN